MSGNREMAKKLGALALSEELSSVSSTYIRQLTTIYISRDPMISSGLWPLHSHAQKTQIHINKNLKVT